ncbi:hypothetical protein CQ018_02150 [Arthrobacter sp. MYb227]|uniref:hypothetical protein n=1 Tax=Arthrobacter sp. MYb227 TaxID=1848601 RepID=UPI000CFC06EC|nr:hypothetical protein [Arthrobacter sp. MYb227]PQZ96106.1 hypothetical protein CQ018_02150 [Arthrobacter sp. MYb227]
MSSFLTFLIVFFGGFFIGGYVAKRKAKKSTHISETGLANAWQEGFEAAQRTNSTAPGIVTVPTALAEGAGTGQPLPRESSPPVKQQPEQHLQATAIPAKAPGENRTPESRPAFASQTEGVPPRQKVFEVIRPAAAGDQAPERPAPWVPVVVDPQVRALRNINITLYIAALLLVAAASLFISLALNPAAKVVGLALVTAGFYAGGLITHKRSERLRPAAVAFASTGLALLPMTGLAYFILLPASAGSVWLITSIIGTAAFVYAAGKLRSRVIAALSTTFMVSTAYAGGAVLNRGLVFYFLFSMLLATGITLATIFKPRWLNNLYLQSFTAAHKYLVPATILAALLSLPLLNALDYTWLFAAACAYYAIAGVVAPTRERYWDQLAGRLAIMLALLSLMIHLEASSSTIARVLSVLFVAQAVALSYRVLWYSRKVAPKPALVRIELWSLLSLGALTSVATIASDALSSSRYQLNANYDWSLPVVLIASILIAVRVRGTFLLTPLVIGLLSLCSFGPLAPGFQSIVLGSAWIATWWLVRERHSKVAQLTKLAWRLTLPLLVARIFVFAAAGWQLSTRAISDVGLEDLPVLPSTLRTQRTIVEFAGMTGFVLGVLCLVAWSIWRLWVSGTETSLKQKRQASTKAKRFETEEILAGFFAGGLLLVFILTAWLQFRRASRGSRTFSGTSWSDEFWLNQDLSQPLMWVILALGLISASVLLGTPRLGSLVRASNNTSMQHSMPGLITGNSVRRLIHGGAAISLGGALWLGAFLEPAWLSEIVALLGLTYVLLRLVSKDAAVPGYFYALAAQILFSATAWHIADRFSMDAHGQFALFALTTTVAQSARLLVGARVAMLGSATTQKAFNLGTLGVLMLPTFSYVGWAAGEIDQAGLLIQLICLLVFIGSLLYTPKSLPETWERWGEYGLWALGAFTLMAFILVPAQWVMLRDGGWLPVGLWGTKTAATILMLLVVAVVLSEKLGIGEARYRVVRALLAAIFLLGVLGICSELSTGWQLVAAVLAGVATIVFAAGLGIPLVLIGTVVFLLIALENALELFRVAALLAPAHPRDDMLLLAGASLILLIGSIFAGRFNSPSVPFSSILQRHEGFAPAHARVIFTSTLILVGVAGLTGLISSQRAYVYLGAGLFMIGALAAAALEFPRHLREAAYEISFVLAAAVLQRCLIAAGIGFEFFGFFYYWVIVIALLAAYEFFRQREMRAVVTLLLAAGLLSLLGLGTIVDSTLSEQLVVLLTFAGLLVFGLLSNRRMFTLWAAIGIGVAVLWFLRGYTFALLLILAALLIALALWRLGKMNQDSTRKNASSRSIDEESATEQGRELR